MNDQADRSGPPRSTSPVPLLAPAVTFFVVVAVLILARNYESLPVKPRNCAFLEWTGIPCMGCGGTRAVRSLSEGNVRAAFRFHPVLVLGIFTIAGWFLWSLVTWKFCERKDIGSKPRIPVGRIFLVGFLILLANWVYLILFLP